MVQRMILNQTAYFGRGAIKEIPGALVAQCATKALVVTGQVLLDTGVAAKVTALLDAVGFPYEVFSDVEPNPPIENVRAGVDRFLSSGADVLLAIGGGSPQDTCKAIGIVAANPEFADVRSLEGVAATGCPSVPIIAVPTTAGTAAEVTINFVITDAQNARKFVCVDPHAIPVIAIVDADMMDGMPADLKAATGLDALTHAIEGYTTVGAWELTDTLLLKAIEIIAQSLPAAAAGDPDAVERMALGQYMAGMGFSNVGLGLVHAMAHPLGAQFGTPHGVANGILLATVMEYNAEHTGEKLRDVAVALGVPEAASLSLEAAGKAAVEAVRDLARSLGNPSSLRQVGVGAEGLDALTDAALADVCASGNPRPATREDVRALYRSVF
ncbi:lactaldehyde reductase [Sanguibacter gelidistatuariae]|uniref:Lactaldehyde reductase n=1 Tax=Sanguibacter gelidistatuariae TaxID=1814289 RepID=A0A1G6UGR9_9MICO|nr:lactaldehyde reductase [Sanguibacter gelidistatuariae]SDD40493.1 lactaldehyde reductase [Sanguibacter gelidistatuariae]